MICMEIPVKLPFCPAGRSCDNTIPHQRPDWPQRQVSMGDSSQNKANLSFSQVEFLMQLIDIFLFQYNAFFSEVPI